MLGPEMHAYERDLHLILTVAVPPILAIESAPDRGEYREAAAAMRKA